MIPQERNKQAIDRVWLRPALVLLAVMLIAGLEVVAGLPEWVITIGLLVGASGWLLFALQQVRAAEFIEIPRVIRSSNDTSESALRDSVEALARISSFDSLLYRARYSGLQVVIPDEVAVEFIYIYGAEGQKVIDMLRGNVTVINI